MSNGDIMQGAGTLTTASEVIRDARDRFDADARRLQQDIAGMASGWRGQGGSAFQNLAVRWRERHEAITRVLSELATGLVETDRDSTVNDANVGSDVTRVARGLETV